MHKFIVLGLTSANTNSFESYERKGIPLLNKYDAKLELSVRSIDGATETHALYFPGTACFEGFLSDPKRMTLKDEL